MRYLLLKFDIGIFLVNGIVLCITFMPIFFFFLPSFYALNHYLLMLLLPGQLPLSFRTPPVSPPRPNYLAGMGMRRVYSLEFRPHVLNSPETGLADPLLGAGGSSGASERSLLPQSTIYNWSCGYFSKPLLTPSDDSEEIVARREEREKFALEHIAKCQHSCGSFSF
jgi:hypothetical protein